MMASLSSGKMSSSDSPGRSPFLNRSYQYAKTRQDSKIDLLDSAESITKKIRKAECVPKVVTDNGVISLVEHILLPASVLKGNGEFRVERKDAEPLVFTDMEQLRDAYRADIVCIAVSHFEYLID
jgi:tyrosyl-tRNA synthetase